MKAGSEYAELKGSVGKFGIGYKQGVAETIAEAGVDINQPFANEPATADPAFTYPFDGKTKTTTAVGGDFAMVSRSSETVTETKLRVVTADYIKNTSGVGGIIGFQTHSQYLDKLNKKSFNVRERFLGLDIKIDAGYIFGGSFNLRLGGHSTDTTYGE